MIEEIINMLERDKNLINIIFCDNQLLLTEQTWARINKDKGLEPYISNCGDKCLILSNKSNIKDYRILTHHIAEKIKVIITCSNKKRVNDIDNLIKSFINFEGLNKCKFNIWIDEIDKTIQLFEEKIELWEKYINIEKICLITATSKNVLKVYPNLQIYPIEESYDRDAYSAFEDSEFKIINIAKTEEIEEYVKKVIKDYSSSIKNNQVWFIPGKVKIESHYNIKDILIKEGFIVIVINGLCKKIFYNKCEDEILNDNNENLADILGDLYIKKNLQLNKLAITGNLCISRGITINSEKMMITHSILYSKIIDESKCYQTAGRICGNIKKFNNYKCPIVYCTQEFKDIIICEEKKSKNLTEKAYKLNKKNISLSDYNMADKEISNKGVPIFVKISKENVKKINTFKKLSNISRQIVEGILKKSEIINVNIDFDINKFRLRNKESIKCTDVDENGKCKYEYIDLLNHYKNKTPKNANSNCKNNEYNIYIITEDIQIWNANAGNALIVYRTID